jgi:hypothetical protein
MRLISDFFRLVLFILPFIPMVFLCFIDYKINLSKENRYKQFSLPFLAAIFIMLIAIYISPLVTFADSLINYLLSIPYLSILRFVNWNFGVHYIANMLIFILYLGFKIIILQIIRVLVHYFPDIPEQISGFAYSYDSTNYLFFLKNKYVQLRKMYLSIYLGAIFVSGIVFIISMQDRYSIMFNRVFYPVYGLIVLGEIVFFFTGITKAEYERNISGEDTYFHRYVEYSKLKDRYKDLFRGFIEFDNDSASSLNTATSYETLDEMIQSNDVSVKNIGNYFQKIKEIGISPDINYIRKSIDLINHKNVIFFTPFYNDLTYYIMLPLIKRMLLLEKCLIITGRDGSSKDVLGWIQEGLNNLTSAPELWKSQIISNSTKSEGFDIGILSSHELYDINLLEKASGFLDEVSFVILIEPSRMLSSGQIGLSMMTEYLRIEKSVTFCAIDRNTDGVVDALSHILKSDIIEVSAAITNSSFTSEIHWAADSKSMSYMILPKLARYFGLGSEIGVYALKNQISKVTWLSHEKFPVIDMKWIVGQFYESICQYVGIPVSQEKIYELFEFKSNIWDYPIKNHGFLIVEDEFRNVFEMSRMFKNRFTQQGFINILSENYLLRDYMQYNYEIFSKDPKAIPTVVSDYSRTVRNVVIKLILLMSYGEVAEDVVKSEFSLVMIKPLNVKDKLSELIKEFTPIDQPNIQVVYREFVSEERLQTEIKCFFSMKKDLRILEYVRNFKNAYFIDEIEVEGENLVSARLYGHVYQKFLPSQYYTIDGKYYEVLSISDNKGVICRRASDHIRERKYYRQRRSIHVSKWSDDSSINSVRVLGELKAIFGSSDFEVSTSGYLELPSNNDLANSIFIPTEGIPERQYKKKLSLRLSLPESTESLRFSIALLLSELFVSIYPDTYNFINIAVKQSEVNSLLQSLVTQCDGCEHEDSIYIFEDSDIDLGLITSIERNILRYLEIIHDFLDWHTFMIELDEDNLQLKLFLDDFLKLIAQYGNKSIYRRVIRYFRKLFKIQTKPIAFTDPSETQLETSDIKSGEIDVEQAELIEQPVETTENHVNTTEILVETTENLVTVSEDKASFESNNTSVNATLTDFDDNSVLHEETSRDTSDKSEEEGKDKETESEEGEVYLTELERSILRTIMPAEQLKPFYRSSAFINYGDLQVSSALEISTLLEYFSSNAIGKGSLYQARTSKSLAEAIMTDYDPFNESAHFCDFCGVEILAGEYDVLADGRERCSQCSSTALNTATDFERVFLDTKVRFEEYYKVKIHVPVKVRMVNAKRMARLAGISYITTRFYDGRVIGLAVSDKQGYCLYIENGSPLLSAIATMAHELTHIWQFSNWDWKTLRKEYGRFNKKVMYEGMAKWAEIQFMAFLGEIAYAKRQEIMTRGRKDEYGFGFRLFALQYPVNYRGLSKIASPFLNKWPIEPGIISMYETALDTDPENVDDLNI